jgi:hypothetical protein
MRHIKIPRLVTCVIITTLSLTACGQENRTVEKKSSKAEGKGFAVLELFTSEGCSSCPPADEVLAKLQQETKGKDVYLLAYHVDYWNRLGWKDIFSNAGFSKRQVQYQSWLGSQIYTPQLIINGKAEFVGSDESAIRNTIESELAAYPVAKLTLHARQDGEVLKVDYQVAGVVNGGSLLIAIIQKNAQTKVEHGENAGRTLSHVQIVHKLQHEPLVVKGDGHTVVALPKGFNAKNWEVLGWIQDQSSGEILSVAKAGLE